MITWFWVHFTIMKLMTSKFFKDNKIAQAHRESPICSLWKISKWLFTPLHKKPCYNNNNNLHKKGITESQDRQNVDSMHTTCNLHLCYMKKRTHFQPVRNL